MDVKNEFIYSLTPEECIQLDLERLAPDALRDLAYYIWCVYQDEGKLMAWREEKLLPLLPDSSVEEADGDE